MTSPQPIQRRVLLPIILLIAAVQALTVGASSAGALSCAGDVRDQISRADVVIVATVTQTRDSGRIARVLVRETWKGRVGSTVEVAADPGIWGTRYQVGTTYLLFLTKSSDASGADDAPYEDHLCSGTRDWTDSLEAYRPASVPSADDASPSPDDERAPVVLPWAIGGAAIVSVSAGLIVVRARSRRERRLSR